MPCSSVESARRPPRRPAPTRQWEDLDTEFGLNRRRAGRKGVKGQPPPGPKHAVLPEAFDIFAPADPQLVARAAAAAAARPGANDDEDDEDDEGMMVGGLWWVSR